MMIIEQVNQQNLKMHELYGSSETLCESVQGQAKVFDDIHKHAKFI